MNSENILEVRRLTKVFSSGGLLSKRRIVAVDDVSFTMPSAKPVVLTLAGESGSGKTTIARLILGFLNPTSGKILYQGRDVSEMSGKEWMKNRKEVQAVFQDPFGAFNPLHKVDRVLFIPVRKFHLANSKDRTFDLISKSLEVVGLRADEILGKYPHQLSGGQRQRIMLARAFLIRPKLIVADEPVSMIDASLRANILNVMLSLREKWKMSFLYITHDLSTARHVSDNIIVLYQGSVVEMGPVDKIATAPSHPYVQLLIDSVPIPDPEKRWQDRIELPQMELTSQSQEWRGCKFYSRCPKRSEVCAEERPNLTEMDSNHWAACHLCSTLKKPA